MKKFAIQTILLILVIGAGIFFFSPKGSCTPIDIPFFPQPSKVANLQINDKSIKVEIADTPSKRSKGLGDRASLGENEGMFFIFDKADKYPFWMKGLSFPLDFVWILDDKVVDTLENIASPKSGQADSSLPIYSSKEAVDKVLELNAGAVKRLNIKVGDSVKLTP